jgi:hypothetical protein
MWANRITPGGAVPRGLRLVALIAVLALGLAACGGGGSASVAVTETAGATDTTPVATPEAEKAAEAEVLDGVLARQRGAVEAFEGALPHLQGRRRALALLFLAQEEEHVDGLLNAFRALGEPASAEPATVEAADLKTESDYLLFLYELESATIRQELSALGRLASPTASTALQTTVANQAQHLVLLRRFLGADLAESVPSPFESGATPPPSVRMDE